MQKSFETPGPVSLDLRVPQGDIEIDPSLEGRVEVELIAHDDDSQRLIDEARIELRQSGTGYDVLVDVPGRKGFGISIIFGRSGISCRVRCPASSDVEVRSKSADVEARGTLGNVNIATASGDTELRAVEGNLSVKSASGDVEAEDVRGNASIQSASGDISLESVGGNATLNTVSGDVRVGEAMADLMVNTVSGDQQHDAVSSGNVKAHSVSGDVHIAVRRGSRVYLDCTTVSGETNSELEVSGEPAAGDGPLVEIRAKTVSGDITITRAPGFPPTPPTDSTQEVHA